MLKIGTALSPSATKILLLGAGELGKEFAIEAQRLGIEVIAVDRYQHAPAMQVAHRSYVIDMLDYDALKTLVAQEKPHYIVPEIEAIATSALLELEAEGYNVVPSANAVNVTMNRQAIRELASTTCGLRTTDFHCITDKSELLPAVRDIGLPCVLKPVMSSSGKGQSVVHSTDELEAAWEKTQVETRGDASTVIVEQFLPFDYEITLLTVVHRHGVTFCEPIGHIQRGGDYQESWQPQAMSPAILDEAKRMAKIITQQLGGYGLFGVELFVRGEEVYFNEVSPRPHDTGMVSLVSQELSEFALHLRAILGLPVPENIDCQVAASKALLAEGNSSDLCFSGLETALSELGTTCRLFGKPSLSGKRRLGVALARADTVEQAREKVQRVASSLQVLL